MQIQNSSNFFSAFINEHAPLEAVYIYFDTATFDEIERDVKVRTHLDKYPEIISSISTADVQAAAKKLAGSKLAMGAVGNLSSVPYIDAL